MSQQTYLFARWQRLIDRGLDGETLRTSELAAVAPLFVELHGDDAALLAQLRRRAVVAGHLLLGEVDATSIAAAVSPISPGEEIYPSIVAATASAVALAGGLFARDPEGAAAQISAHLDLEHAVDAGSVAETCVAPPLTPPAPMPLDDPAHLVLVTWGLPLLDLLSPYVRDTATSLRRFARAHNSPDLDDDNRYALLPALFAKHPQLWTERCQQDAQVGIYHRAPGVVDVDFVRLDRQAVDVRVRNAVAALQRRRARWRLIAPGSVPGLLSAGVDAESMSDVILAGPALALRDRGARVFCPQALRHAAGHRLLCDGADSAGMKAVLDREVKLQPCEESLTLPAAAHLRDPVLQALASAHPVIDALSSFTALALSLWAEAHELGDAGHGPPVFLASAGAEGALAQALIKLAATGDRRRQAWPG